MKQKLMLLCLVGMVVFSGCGAKEQKENEMADPVQENVAEELKEEEEEEMTTEENSPEEVGEDETVVEEGETSEETSEGFSFEDVANLEFYFSSGAGGWDTVLHFGKDGSFKGVFHDSDMGDTGEDYAEGTLYYSEFTGQFTSPEKVNEYTYKFQMQDISYKNEIGTEEIKDEVKYVYTDAYGLDGAEDFYMYLPSTPIDELSEEFMMWVGPAIQEDTDKGTLGFYALCNVKQEYGFSSYEMLPPYDLAINSLEATQEYVKTLEDKLENENLTQLDMNFVARDIYDGWDSSLNYIWSLVKDKLPEEEYNKVLEEQRKWVEEKEQKVAAAGAEYEGGSMQPLVEHTEAAKLTKARAYELAEYLK